MHLVLNHVAELEHIGHTDRCLLVELLTSSTIIQLRGAVAGQACLVRPFAEVVELSTIKDRRGELHTEFAACCTENGLEHLTDVHTRRHTQRVEYDINGRTILEEGHILLADNLGNNTLVTVTTSHLITDTNLTLLGYVNLGHLDDAAGQFVANSNGKLLTLELSIHDVVLLEVIDDELTNEHIGVLIVGPVAKFNGSPVNGFEEGLAELSTLGDNLCADIILNALRSLVLQEREEFVNHDALEFSSLSIELFVQFQEFLLVGSLRRTILDGFGVKLAVNHDTRERGVGLQGSVLHVASLVTEDGAQQFFFGRGVALTLRRNLTNHDIARHDAGTDADDTILVKVLGSLFADIGNIVGEFLHTALGLAHFEGEFVHVNGSENIITNETFVEHDGVLVVVTLPRHVGHEKVATESELTIFGSVTFGEDVALLDALSLLADGTEVNGHILVGTAELGNLVFLCGRVEADELFVLGAVVGNTNGCSVHIVNHAIAFGRNHGARIFANLLFNACTYNRCFAADEGNGLAHHV